MRSDVDARSCPHVHLTLIMTVSTAAGQAEVGNANDVATVTQVPAASHVTKLREIQVTYDMLSNGTASR